MKELNELSKRTTATTKGLVDEIKKGLLDFAKSPKRKKIQYFLHMKLYKNKYDNKVCDEISFWLSRYITEQGTHHYRHNRFDVEERAEQLQVQSGTFVDTVNEVLIELNQFLKKNGFNVALATRDTVIDTDMGSLTIYCEGEVKYPHNGKVVIEEKEKAVS